jgi:Zn-dependent protease
MDPMDSNLVPSEPGFPAAMPMAEAGGEALPLDPLTEQVLVRLGQPPPRPQWWQTIALLVGSLVVFGAAGLIQNSMADLAILVLVLLFHETGHYAGMRLFNYQDVRMFFIPFFGAAVSGRKTNVPGYQEAIVLLLGPLPGIALGVVLGAASVFYDNPLLRTAALMLIGLNAFNLLPLLPLDGGRLLQLVLFSRQRHLEAAFRVLTALVLAWISYAIGAWLLLGVAVMMLISTGATIRTSSIISRWRRSGLPPPTSASGPIPAAEALPLVQQVRAAFPQIKDPKGLATLVRNIIERLHASPPGILGSIVALVLHVGSFVVALVALVLLHLPARADIPRDRMEGRDMPATAVNLDDRVWPDGPLAEPHGTPIIEPKPSDD